MEPVTPSDKEQTECQRCGICCRKGGPALHIEDKPLVASGKIPLKDLMTFRQGEPVLDNVTNHIAPAVTDIIRLAPRRNNQPDCVFYDRTQKRCDIYDQRPAECEALKCWDTAEIKDLYNTRRLTRRHLLADVKGLWDLVEEHQDHCDYAYVAELADKINRPHPDQAASAELLEIVRYDKHLREVTAERTDWDPGMLLFMFGRPLSFTIRLFEMKTTETEQGTTIEPTGGKVCYRRI